MVSFKYIPKLLQKKTVRQEENFARYTNYDTLEIKAIIKTQVAIQQLKWLQDKLTVNIKDNTSK